MSDCVNTNSGVRAAQSKWQQILGLVRGELASGCLAAGSQFYTIRELAAKYNVSTLTAQRVFRELTQLGLIESQGRRGTWIRGAASSETVLLCLRDDHFSRRGGMRNFQTINSLVAGIRNGFDGRGFDDVKPISFRFLQQNLKSVAGHPLLVSANVFLDVADERTILNHERLSRVTKSLRPVVFHCFAELPGVSQVVCDLYQGIRQAVDHLVAAGHVSLAFLSGPLHNVWFRPRFQAFSDGLFAHNLPLMPEYIKVTTGRERNDDFQAVAALLALPQPPTAIVCANDGRALHVLEYCKLHGVDVPGALAVTGFDNLAEGSLCQPELTTVDGRDFEMGRQCAALLWRGLQGDLMKPETVHVVPQLLVRESSIANRQVIAV